MYRMGGPALYGRDPVCRGRGGGLGVGGETRKGRGLPCREGHDSVGAGLCV